MPERWPTGNTFTDGVETAKINCSGEGDEAPEQEARADSEADARLTVKLVADDLHALFGRENRNTREAIYRVLLRTLIAFDERRTWLCTEARRESMAEALRHQLAKHIAPLPSGPSRFKALRVALRRVFNDDDLYYAMKPLPIRDPADPIDPAIEAILGDLLA